MKSQRELVFDRVEQALRPLQERTPLPEFSDDLVIMRGAKGATELWKLFSERMQLLHGMTFTSTTELGVYLRQQGWLHGYCDPSLLPLLIREFGPGFNVENHFDRKRINDYQFGITRAQGAIAETGTIILKDKAPSPRLAALAPWVHIAVFKESEIFADLPTAVKALGDDPNIVWVTGPSKTGDVESILIEGVHGPGVQIGLLLK